MDLLDKVLLEWSARTDKGYPDLNNKQDLAIFESMFGLKLNEQDNEEPSTNKTIEDIVNERINDPELKKRVVDTFYNLSKEVQNNLLENYLDKFSFQQFKSKIDIINNELAPFYIISNKKGVGRGEFIPLLSIKNAKSGGTAQKDVIIGDTVLEVKELTKRAFKTAASGTATSSDLSNNISTFIKYGPDNSLLKELPALKDIIDSILAYYNDKYKKGNLSGNFRDNINLFIKKLKENKDDIAKKAENLEYVKLNGKRYTYTDLGGGTFKLEDEVSEGLANLAKLLKHPYFVGSTSPLDDLEKLKIEYFDSLNYILFFSEGGKNPIILSSEEAKDKVYVIDLNQGSVRLGYGKTSEN